MKILFHPMARRDLRAAVAYYKEQGGPEVVRALLAEYEHALALLANNPALGTEVDQARRNWPLKRFPFSIISRVTATEMRVLAMWHQRRNPQDWQRRH